MRLLSATAIAAGALCACLEPLPPDVIPAGGSLAVWEENHRDGSNGWDDGESVAADSVLSGFGLPGSVQIGETLHVFVSARQPLRTIAAYRLGWYNGAGGRLVEQHRGVATPDQPACSPAVPGPMVCPWSETDRFVVGPGWKPGVYVVRMVDALGWSRTFPFVVRSNQAAPFTVVLSFATYAAYNQWGGTSLYGGPGATRQESYATRAVETSFARPFSASVIQGQFFGVDYLLVRWLEHNAYDVNYLTDFDFHLGRGIDPTAGWLFAGHSEYWTWPMWLRANDARNRGINLAFLGGNDIYWLARFETVTGSGWDIPVLVCFRDATRDPLGNVPGLATVQFRSSPNNTPENALVGIMSGHPSLVRGSPIDLVVADGSDPLLSGTGLTTGAHISRVAGWEADRIVDNGATPPGIRTLFQSPFISGEDSVTQGVMQSTVYTWSPSGALVYASGEPGFAWGLESVGTRVARPPLERLLRNVLQAFIAAPARR
jgi:hypothetical protein